MNAAVDAALAEIGRHLGRDLSAGAARPVGGGCINAAWRLGSRQGDVFLKTNDPALLPMFEAEAEALRELGGAAGVRVPEILGSGVSGAVAWLALEYIETGRAGSQTERLLGAGLARQHGCLSDRFGWHRDNTIGSTPQPNPREDRWPVFFSRHRLGFQLDLARDQGWPGSMIDAGRRLQEAVAAFFVDGDP